MAESTFAQPIEEYAITPLTIVGADAGFDIFSGIFSEVDDSWHDYPEQAAAGLWTTSSDYAKFAAALINAARGIDNPIPSSMAKEMIARQTELAQGKAYGLGTQLIYNETDALKFISHSGANTGYRALFAARPAAQGKPGRIVVSIANTQSGAGLNKAIVFALTDR